MKHLEFVGGGALAVVTGFVGLIAVIVFLGLVAPYVHSICVTGTARHPRIDDHWGLYLSGALPNPAPDSEGCIRNTPTREALSAIGIWDLGTPESQLASHLSR